MFKTISAALLAVSVIAAPAMAAGTGKIAQAPASKSVQAPVIKQAPAIKMVQIKNEQAKTGLLNANAKMHHHKHYRHHRHHKEMGALKTHAKVSFKHIAPTAKRG